jgi:hypothetical protein
LGRFAPQRLITEGVIVINAAVCTLLALADHPRTTKPERTLSTRRMTLIGVVCALAAVASGALLKPALLGERNDGAAMAIRFGPNNTNDRR